MQQTVAVFGAAGQLGQELLGSAAEGVVCRGFDRASIDISDTRAVAGCIADLRPDLVINAAAYTAVDRAEAEPDAAFAVNAQGAANVARACRDSGARLLHVSTDFVFDGRSSRPYTPGDATGPLGEYGRGKLAGELAVREALPEALVVRTGWVYSVHGNNFVKTMLRLLDEREVLSVVDDQVGTPTWARGLAGALWAAAERTGLKGTYHWSDAGVCSWYDFAQAIAEEACSLGILAGPAVVRPTPASGYPTPAARPAYSVLDKSASWRDLDLEGVHWRVQLRSMLAQLKESQHG